MSPRASGPWSGGKKNPSLPPAMQRPPWGPRPQSPQGEQTLGLASPSPGDTVTALWAPLLGCTSGCCPSSCCLLQTALPGRPRSSHEARHGQSRRLGHSLFLEGVDRSLETLHLGTQQTLQDRQMSPPPHPMKQYTHADHDLPG